jgi:hypothetical protein
MLKSLRTPFFCTISRVQTPFDGDTVDLLAPVVSVRTGALVGATCW